MMGMCQSGKGWLITFLNDSDNVGKEECKYQYYFKITVLVQLMIWLLTYNVLKESGLYV